MNTNPLRQEPLTKAEVSRLYELLSRTRNENALSLDGMDGLFCALIASGQRVLRSEYLPIIWGGEPPEEPIFESLEKANTNIALIIRHWNSIITELESKGFHVPLIFEPAQEVIPGRAWARGFMRGVALALADWIEFFADENEGQLMTIPLVAGDVDPEWPREPLTKEKSELLLTWMAIGVTRSYQHFAAERRKPNEGSVPPVH
jgi:uncharacterized protein